MMSKKVFCQGCEYFFITHRIKRPWGCKKFGFVSKILPSSEVFMTTGMECAYKKEVNLKNRGLKRMIRLMPYTKVSSWH